MHCDVILIGVECGVGVSRGCGLVVMSSARCVYFFFFNDTATTEIYTE